MPKTTPVFVGLNVHKETISVAYAAGGLMGLTGPHSALQFQPLSTRQAVPRTGSLAHLATSSGRFG
jgi:hypothetical protein